MVEDISGPVKRPGRIRVNGLLQKEDYLSSKSLVYDRSTDSLRPLSDERSEDSP